MRFISAGRILVGSLLWAATCAYADAPVNDNFSDRQVLTGTNVLIAGSNVSATAETGEPVHGNHPGGQSVWYTWTPPSDGQAHIWLDLGPYFGGLLGVYTGSALNELTSLGQAAYELSPWSPPHYDMPDLTLRVQADTPVQIAVDGYNWYYGFLGATGEFTLNLAFSPAPANDFFTNRIVLSGTNTTATADNSSATREPGEPWAAPMQLLQGKTIWWTWTAPADALVTLDTLQSACSAEVAVFTGDSISSLVRVAAGSSLRFRAAAGQTYQILADSSGGFGLIAVHLSTSPISVPPNDQFANRIPLPGGWSGAVEADSLGATAEAGEPELGPGTPAQHSLWWTWTAPTNGVASFSCSSVYHRVGAYAGTDVADLETIAVNTNSFFALFLTFPVVAGNVYQIRVDGNEGLFTLSYSLTEYPYNDNFENRGVLSGESAADQVDNRYATKEEGEPDHAGLSGGRSVWWTWTAPRSSRVILNSDVASLLAVYTGESLGALNVIASSAYEGVLEFEAIGGVSYQIAVDSYWPSGAGIGSLALACVALNDNFEAAAVLPGPDVSASVSNLGASCEPGEPDHAGYGASHSLWWKWTTAGRCHVTVSTGGSSFDTVLGIYTGTTISNLVAVASNDNAPDGGGTSAVEFDAHSQEPYWIVVDGVGGATGSIELTLTATPLAEPLLEAPSVTSAGQVSFRIWANPGQSITVQGSTNLVNWRDIGSYPVLNGAADFLGGNIHAAPHEYYRAVANE